jgi:hypothetical protein
MSIIEQPSISTGTERCERISQVSATLLTCYKHADDYFHGRLLNTVSYSCKTEMKKKAAFEL